MGEEINSRTKSQLKVRIKARSKDKWVKKKENYIEHYRDLILIKFCSD